MQGVPRHGDLDLCRKNGKTSWNALELGFAGISNVFFWTCITVSVTLKKKKERATLPDPRVTSPDQKPDVFLLNDFPLGQEHIPVETHPRQNKLHARTNFFNCNKPVCDS